MKVSINKMEANIFQPGNIIEFEFENKSIIGIYLRFSQIGHSVVILHHPTIKPGTIAEYTRINNVRLFEGTITLSND